MAAAEALKSDPGNSCCNAWKKKYLKTEEKRNALRRSVEILTQQIDKCQAESVNLKKELEEEQARIGAERKEKSKESALRESLENEISVLKCEISSLQKEGSDIFSRNKELELLKSHLTDRESEISNLKELLEKERERSNLEKKSASAEKARADAEKEGKLKEEAVRKSLESEISALKSEITLLQQKASSSAEDENERVTLLQAHISEMAVEISKLNELLEKEKKNADAEKARVDAEKEEKLKELAVRKCLENEISALKSEITLLQKKASSTAEDENERVMLLQAHMSEMAVEINKLNELLAKEKKNANAEKARADAAKEGKLKELAVRKSLEDEISASKSEIALLQQKASSNSELQAQISVMDAEVTRLKELLEKEKKKSNAEKARADAEEEGKLKGLAARKSLENEISALKSEITLLQQKASSSAEDGNERVELLQSCISEKDVEINKLKELLEKEKKKASLGKKNASAEKSRADAEKEGKLKELAVRKALENEVSALKSEISLLQRKASASAEDGNERVQLVQARISDMDVEIKKLKGLLEKEKKRAKLEKKVVETEKKKTLEAWRVVESEKCKASEERKLASMEKKKAEEYRLQLDLLKREADETRSQLVLQLKKLEEANQKLEAERVNALKERKHAELAKARAEELRKLAEENKKKALEEKLNADQLVIQVEEDRKKIEGLQKEMCQARSSARPVMDFGVSSEKIINAEMKLLKKQLRCEKRQLKHAKQVMQFEKNRSNILQQELSCLKLEFLQFSQRLDLLDRCFLPGVEDFHVLDKVYKQNANEHGKRGCAAMGASNLFKERLQHPVGIGLESISGIDSQMESLLGGSNRKLLQSSAINSSTASFSDGQLMGSQGRGSFSVTTSAKLVDDNVNVRPTISSLSDDIAKIGTDKRAIVAENSVSPLRIDGVEYVNAQSRKRKRIVDAVDSIECLYGTGKKLHMQIEEKLSDLRGILDREMIVDCEGGKNLCSNLQGSSHGKHDKVHKKQKISSGRELVIQPSCVGDRHKRRATIETEIYEDARTEREVSRPDTVQECRRENIEFAITRGETIISSDIDSWNYMKLLDLDNVTDEERYRMAMEMPLSPTLPEIELQSSGGLDLDNSRHSVGANLIEKLPNNEDGSNASYGSGGDAGYCSTSSTINICDVELHTSNMSVSAAEQVGFASKAELPKVFAVPSDIRDSNTLSRIVHATRNCTVRCSLVSETEWMVQKVLAALALEEDLSSKDKSCVFFSMLLLNFICVILGKSGDSLKRDYSVYANSFSKHIQEVLSDLKAGDIFSRIICLDDLLCIIEEFLVDGTIMHYDCLSPAVSHEVNSKIRVMLDDVHINMSPEAASSEYLVAGSTILASICLATDNTGFICEASYNICRRCKYDPPLMLTILHVFARLCGGKFFNRSGETLLVTVLRAIVIHLESSPVVEPIAMPLLNEVRSDFSPCINCPFSADGISIDGVTSVLLEKIQGSLSSVQKNYLVEAANKLDNQVPLGNADQNQHKGCLLDMNCKYKMPVTQSDGSADENLCYFVHLLSLVELLASVVSWDWACVKLVPQLLKLLGSHLPENFAASLVILLGHLGRIGVNAGGTEDKGVKILITELSAFLRHTEPVEVGFNAKIATVISLLDLLSLGFVEVIQDDGKLSALAPVDTLRTWVSLLNKERQESLFSLLNSLGVHNKLSSAALR